MPRKGGDQATRKEAELMGEGLGASSRSGPVDEHQLGHNAAIQRKALVCVKVSRMTRNWLATIRSRKHWRGGRSSKRGCGTL